MTYPYYDPNMGGIIPKFIKKAVGNTIGFIVGKGNIPGTPETRKYGYDRQEVATAAANQIIAQENSPLNLDNASQTQKMLMLGAAGLGIALLLSSDKKKGPRR